MLCTGRPPTQRSYDIKQDAVRAPRASPRREAARGTGAADCVLRGLAPWRWWCRAGWGTGRRRVPRGAPAGPVWPGERHQFEQRIRPPANVTVLPLSPQAQLVQTRQDVEESFLNDKERAQYLAEEVEMLRERNASLVRAATRSPIVCMLRDQ